MFDEDEKYEKYIDDYEYGDYDEQDMNRSFSTKRKKSNSTWNWTSSNTSGSGHTSVQSFPLQNESFEKCFPEWLILAVTIVNVILLIVGLFSSLNFYFWLIVYIINLFLAMLDFGLIKQNYHVEDKDIVSHYIKERAKNMKKMWYALTNMLMVIVVPFALVEFNFDLMGFMPLAIFFLMGLCMYWSESYTYKNKLQAIRDSRKKKPLKIYVASSWRNEYYPSVVSSLRDAGFNVYDFRNPPTGEGGFKWSYIDENYMNWTPEQYREHLKNNPLAVKQLQNDIEAMKSCEACVLVLPCGRSAHTEAGWFCGAGKKVVAYIPCKQEPELMYGLFDGVATSIGEVVCLLN